MKTCIWYDVSDKLPNKSGYYLAFKGMSMGDNETDTDYYYWNATVAEWRDSRLSNAHYANVVYWTEADPNGWYEDTTMLRRKNKNTMSVTEAAAWDDLQEAVKRYETIRALCAKS